MKRVIWSNYDLDIEDWRDGYKECMGIDEPITDDDVYTFMEETNADYLDDERMNLDVETEGRILIIADLGLWHGRKSGYRILNNRNVNAVLQYNYDYAEFYGDGKDLRGTEWHHDGVNYYTYREIREDRDIDKLLNAIYNGEEISRQKLNYYTKSLYPYVAERYGW
jgi:hypothetical protein